MNTEEIIPKADEDRIKSAAFTHAHNLNVNFEDGRAIQLAYYAGALVELSASLTRERQRAIEFAEWCDEHIIKYRGEWVLKDGKWIMKDMNEIYDLFTQQSKI